MRTEPVAETSGMRLSVASFSPTCFRSPMRSEKIAGSAPVFRHTRSAILVTAIALSGVFSDGEVADVDHLLHLTFAFRENFSRLERHQCAEIVLMLAQGVAELAHGFAADRSGSGAPFQKSLMRSPNDLLVILRRGGPEFA